MTSIQTVLGRQFGRLKISDRDLWGFVVVVFFFFVVLYFVVIVVVVVIVVLGLVPSFLALSIFVVNGTSKKWEC